MKPSKTVCVCCDTNCLAGGGGAVADALRDELARGGLEQRVAVAVKRTGCHGLCQGGPVLRVMPDNISYYGVAPEDVAEIVSETVEAGRAVERLLYKTAPDTRVRSEEENPFYKKQCKVTLRNVGKIDPLDMVDALERGVYEGLRAALAMPPGDVIREVLASGLRGRGGAGFPTGRKWSLCAAQSDDVKYVVCNSDEGDPGAFMDRAIFEGDPHSVLEGLAIAAYAVGARQGFIYVRDEYARTITHIQHAAEEARARGFLGRRVLDSDFSFDVEIVRGGGAFVCGEETALLASIEGRVGEPRPRPPYPAQQGLWGKPTAINNVETLAVVPFILRHGGARFRALGTESSPGTKVFTLVGKVRRTGLIEVEMGTPLRRIVFDIGGGMQKHRRFKAVQTGGPSGGCLPESLLDLPVEYETLVRYGSMMGSGGMIVMDDRTCMVEVARYYIAFLSEESCGKCAPCRDGLRMLLQLLAGLCEGRGREGDLELMESLCETLQSAALCGLGKSAVNPVLTTLAHFREEYREHLRGFCRAGVCPALTRFTIDPAACRGCTLCVSKCPTVAITGEKSSPHQIDKARCIGCGACREACAFEAVTVSESKEVPTCG